MKEMTREEAIRFGEEGVWKKLTPVERAWMQLYQTRICMPLDVIYDAMQALFGRPVYSHEMWLDAMASLRKEAVEHRHISFAEVLEKIPTEKRIVVLKE
jgi:hypothetical protein